MEKINPQPIPEVAQKPVILLDIGEPSSHGLQHVETTSITPEVVPIEIEPSGKTVPNSLVISPNANSKDTQSPWEAPDPKMRVPGVVKDMLGYNMDSPLHSYLVNHPTPETTALVAPRAPRPSKAIDRIVAANHKRMALNNNANWAAPDPAKRVGGEPRDGFGNRMGSLMHRIEARINKLTFGDESLVAPVAPRFVGAVGNIATSKEVQGTPLRKDWSAVIGKEVGQSISRAFNNHRAKSIENHEFWQDMAKNDMDYEARKLAQNPNDKKSARLLSRGTKSFDKHTRKIAKKSGLIASSLRLT